MILELNISTIRVVLTWYRITIRLINRHIKRRTFIRRTLHFHEGFVTHTLVLTCVRGVDGVA